MAPSDMSEFAGNHLVRIETLERFVSNQGNSISTVVEGQAALIRRVEQLEALSRAREITEAREDERDKALYDRLDRMDKSIAENNTKIENLKAIGAKALWVFMSAFIVGAATFIIKGGLH